MQLARSFANRMLPVLAMLLLPGIALAGTAADTEFQGLRTVVTNWAQGNLAVTLVLGTAIVGAVVGLARVTAMPMLTSVVFALIFSVIVGFTTGIIGAVI